MRETMKQTRSKDKSQQQESQSQTCITSLAAWTRLRWRVLSRRHLALRPGSRKQLKQTNCHFWRMRGGVATRPVCWGGGSHGVFLSPVLSRLIVPADTEDEEINYSTCLTIPSRNTTVLVDFQHSPVSRRCHSNQPWKAAAEDEN